MLPQTSNNKTENRRLQITSGKKIHEIRKYLTESSGFPKNAQSKLVVHSELLDKNKIK